MAIFNTVQLAAKFSNHKKTRRHTVAQAGCLFIAFSLAQSPDAQQRNMAVEGKPPGMAAPE
jgi:hypothetical protein